jgi:hypothetical protein
MPFDDDDGKKVFIALVGALTGAAIVQNHYDEKRKSRAEREDPGGAQWICDLVWRLLDDWEPGDFPHEDDYTDDLFDFLNQALEEELEEGDPDVTVEMRRDTLHGIPDILVNKKLVLELKLASKKTERDRLVGQCCEYSRGFVTWAILMHWPDDRIEKLIDLLEAKSLNYIEVIPYDRIEVGEDDEEED